MGQADKVWSAFVTPLARRTEEWWGSVMVVGLDPELAKWSMRSGPAIVLSGKGYKEHHWLVVSLINHFGYFPSPITTTVYLHHAIVRSHHPRNSRSIRQGSCRGPCSWPDRQPHQRWEGHYPLHVQRGRLPCKFPYEFVIVHLLILVQYARDEEGREYPPANDFYRCSNTHDPDQDGFEDLFHWDFIHAISRVARRKLSHHHLDLYQRTAFRRGIVRHNTGEEERDPVLETAMEYAGALGVIIFDESCRLRDLTEAQIGRN